MSVCFIVSRFEGEYAVLEDDKRKIQSVPKNLIANGTSEGDIVFFDSSTDLYLVDKKKTATRRKKMNDLINRMFIIENEQK